MTTKPSDDEITAVYERHVAAVYRLCFSYMKARTDTEDAVQETFLRLIRSWPTFASETHEEAWLVRTASNVCKDQFKRASRTREIPSPDNVRTTSTDLDADTGSEVMERVLGLPNKYKALVYLYYYEGYPTEQIAQMLNQPHSTVRNRLAKAREMLKMQMGEADEE